MWLISIAAATAVGVVAASTPVLAPSVPHSNAVVDLAHRRVDVYSATDRVATFPVAIGKPGWETPKGIWKVTEKIVNPGWTNFLTGKVMAPGGNNPMGSRWIGFYKDRKGEVGFHGTKNVASIGKAASHGCLRMREADVQKLYQLLDVGSVVRIE